MEKLYEGKAKILYQTDDPDILLTYYKDDATAFNAQKRGQIVGKGEINCTVSTALFQWLESLGIPTHYIDRPSSREMRVKAIKIIMMEWHKKGPDALVKHLQDFGFIIFSRMPRSKNVGTLYAIKP